MATVNAPQDVQAAQRLNALRQAMPAGAGTLYGILDTAIDEALYEALQAEPQASKFTCLYDGAPAIRYARYAPYLIKLHDGSPLFQRWLDEGWTAHWGIFIASRANPAEIKRHLKKFLQATDPHKRTVWVRFYDPRVLPNWLRGLNPGHLADWFGGGIYACCAPNAQGLWRGQAQRSALDQWTGAATLDAQLFRT